MFWGPVPYVPFPYPKFQASLILMIYRWVYLGESFPLRVRPKAIAMGSAMNWLWNFLLSFFAPKIAAEYVCLALVLVLY
jgi:hypothetical protein